jgi:excinuclease UvrABC nuclease subunit
MNNTVRWLSYDFTVYAPTKSWNDVAGVYIFTGVNNLNQWVALYVGQTDSFRNRIPSHEQWNPAVRLGATHIHAMVVPLAATRDIVERELIQAYQPRLNAQQR